MEDNGCVAVVKVAKLASLVSGASEASSPTTLAPAFRLSLLEQYNANCTMGGVLAVGEVLNLNLHFLVLLHFGCALIG